VPNAGAKSVAVADSGAAGTGPTRWGPTAASSGHLAGTIGGGGGGVGSRGGGRTKREFEIECIVMHVGREK
jgi:hypothetical protein